MVELAPGTILEHAIPVSIFKGFNFEGLPNRDSLKYIKLYGLNEQKLETMFRGTLRYKVLVNRDSKYVADLSRDRASLTRCSP